MTLAAYLLASSCLLDPVPSADDSEEAKQARWRRIFDGVAAEYQLVSDAESEPLKLLNRATYTWARSGPHGGTYGAVYIWTNQGNAEAVACFWRSPGPDGKLSVAHELHSLSPIVLNSRRVGPHHWQPQAGVKRHLVPDAPAPASSSAGRLQQMRAICRDFSARSVSSGGDRTELRLLPQPLYRYQSTNPAVVDGALFAFVCSIGTDPEVFLQLEAIKTAHGTEWHYAVSRFSHMNLFVNHKEREVWQAIRGAKDTISHSEDNTYWLFHEPFDLTPLDAAIDE